MGLFGEFVYSADVYGLDGDLIVEPLSYDTILITFTTPVVVDSAYLDPSNYTIAVVSGTGPIQVRSVLEPTSVKVIQQAILVVDKPHEGTHYRVTATGVSTRVGVSGGGTSDFMGRRTKTGNMLRALPKHFDKRPESVIATILSAIGISDDLIGGARDDTFL